MTWLAALVLQTALLTAAWHPVVQAEELVYTPTPTTNGAGPMWCYGSCLLVRHGADVFISGIENLPGERPLNNVRWVLYHRGALPGWSRVRADPGDREREPCPLVVTDEGRLYLSSNPSLARRGAYSGRSLPIVLEFGATDAGAAYGRALPTFARRQRFGDITYRGFAGDGGGGELLLFQIRGHAGYQWCLRDRRRQWDTAGELAFPLGLDYERAQSIRCCYPELAVRGREVHVLAVSDIVEPVRAWRRYKRQVTHQRRDYDFRRLFYTWTPDIAIQPFDTWLEVASQEQTCGTIANLDLWLDHAGRAHLLWLEESVHQAFLRDRFFPGVKQRWSLHHGVVERGRLTANIQLAVGGEGLTTPVPRYGRFHVTADGRLLCLYYVTGHAADGRLWHANRLVELGPDGAPGEPVQLPFARAFSKFMTASPRAGSHPSDTLDVFGQCVGDPGLWYAQVDVRPLHAAHG